VHEIESPRLGGVGRNKTLHKKCGFELLIKPTVSLKFSWKWSEVKSFVADFNLFKGC